MVDLKEKSREEIFREKKEAELREAKRREGEWKRHKDKERKCMIGGTFYKYFPDALLFEANEWDRITQAVIETDAFKNTIEAIRKEAAVKQKSQEQEEKQDEKTKKQEQHTERQKAENGGQEQKHEGGNNGQLSGQV